MQQERIIEIERALIRSRFQFAIKCMHKVIQMMPKSDIAFSPHSIYEGLLLVYFMSSGAIEERLKLILYLNDVSKYDLIQYYSSRRDSEQSGNNASAASSDYDAESRCWIKATNFNHLLTLKNIFNNGLEVFEPDNTPIEKIDCINKAIQSSVKKHICNPVKFIVVRDDMELFLMTVSRLNAPKFQIVDCEFEASYVPIFQDKRERRSFFSRELNMHVNEFLYTSEKTSLFVFRPSAKTLADFSVREFIANGISNLIERLSTEEGISTLRNLLDSDTKSEDAGFSIDPIFDLEGDLPMRELLRALGIEELLKPDAINLDSFFVNDDSVHLGNAMHRIRVKVTENYTAAGAVNIIFTGQGTPSECKKNFDKFEFPCVWLIYDKQRRNVLFAGAFNDFDHYTNIPSPPLFIYEPVDIINISL